MKLSVKDGDSERHFRLHFRYGWAVPDGPPKREFTKFKETTQEHDALRELIARVDPDLVVDRNEREMRKDFLETLETGLMADHHLVEAILFAEDRDKLTEDGKPTLSELARATSYCSPLDKYIREEGRKKSIARVLEEIAPNPSEDECSFTFIASKAAARTFRTAFWKAYHSRPRPKTSPKKVEVTSGAAE